MKKQILLCLSLFSLNTVIHCAEREYDYGVDAPSTKVAKICTKQKNLPFFIAPSMFDSRDHVPQGSVSVTVFEGATAAPAPLVESPEEESEDKTLEEIHQAKSSLGAAGLTVPVKRKSDEDKKVAAFIAHEQWQTEPHRPIKKPRTKKT